MSGRVRWLQGSLALALVASLAANVYLVVRAPPPPVKAPHAGRNEESCDPACSAELETCRRAASGLALGLWGMKVSPSASAQAPPPESPPPVGESRSAAICRIARDKMKQQWLEKKSEIAAGLARDLPDEAKQRAEAQRDADHAADVLGLEGRARRGFEEDFVDGRARQMAGLAILAQATPVDWSKLLAGARSLLGAEDALVEGQLGSDALARYRAAEMDGRITILSILATYANVDWDETIAGQP
jgi:hypothetical protein